MAEILEEPNLPPEDYDFLKQVNESHVQSFSIDNLSPYDLSKGVESTDWIYSSFSEHRLRNLRILYIASFAVKVISFIIGELLFPYEYTTHTVTPISLQHGFTTAAWIFLIGL